MFNTKAYSQNSSETPTPVTPSTETGQNLRQSYVSFGIDFRTLKKGFNAVLCSGCDKASKRAAFLKTLGEIASNFGNDSSHIAEFKSKYNNGLHFEKVPNIEIDKAIGKEPKNVNVFKVNDDMFSSRSRGCGGGFWLSNT